MEQTGIFLKAGEIKTFDSGFKVQEFYLDCRTYNQFTGEPIENLLKFQVSGDRISLLNGVKKDDLVKVHFNIKGKLFDKEDGTKGHGQNLNVWKIEPVDRRNYTPEPSVKPEQTTKPTAETEEVEDDLPF